MKREQYMEEIDALRKKQEEIWNKGLTAYLESVRCQLGTCGQMETLELAAKTCEDPEARQKAHFRLEAEKAHRQRGWTLAEREVRQLEVTISKLRERADGRI